MAINIKAKIEEIKDKIANDKNISDEFTAAPAKTVCSFFNGEISEDDASIISDCIKSEIQTSGINDESASYSRTGYYYGPNENSFIYVESAKVTFYRVTYSSYTNMCGITNDNIFISSTQFAVTLPANGWYYFVNGVKTDGNVSLPVQGTCSGSTITISGTKYTK